MSTVLTIVFHVIIGSAVLVAALSLIPAPRHRNADDWEAHIRQRSMNDRIRARAGQW